MQIQPAFAAGIQGLQSAQSGLTQATVDVAQAVTQPATTSSTDTSSAVAATPKSRDKTDALVSAMASQRQGEASVDVLQRENDALGSIIDIEV